MKTLDIIIYALLIIGGLNWGLVGVFDFDLVAAIFGDMSGLSRIIYTVVGLAAIYDLVLIKAIWKRWGVHYRAPAHA
jgi:uncharacterized membrane protein YuzA (DUF378 family)